MKYCPHFNDWRLVTLPGLTCQILPGSFSATSFTRKRGKCKLNSQWSLFLQKIFALSQGEGQVPFSEWIFCRLPCSSLLTLTYKFPRFPSLSARFPHQAKEGAVPDSTEGLLRLWLTETLSFVVCIHPEPRTPKHCHRHRPPAKAAYTGYHQGRPPWSCGASVARLQSTDGGK